MPVLQNFRRCHAQARALRWDGSNDWRNCAETDWIDFMFCDRLCVLSTASEVSSREQDSGNGPGMGAGAAARRGHDDRPRRRATRPNRRFWRRRDPSHCRSRCHL